jgi:hypothetical protein
VPVHVLRDVRAGVAQAPAGRLHVYAGDQVQGRRRVPGGVQPPDVRADADLLGELLKPPAQPLPVRR